MERKIGEVFPARAVTLKVVEAQIDDSCYGCYFEQHIECPNTTKKSVCVGYERTDKTDVIFVKQD